MDVKKYTKKLRGKQVIEVDSQIKLWRSRLKKQGVTIGRHTAAHKEKMKAQTERDRAARAERKDNKKFFE